MSIDAYNQQIAVSDDPYILVLKLYEGVIKYLSFVKSAMNDNNIEQKFTYINKTIAIFDTHIIKSISFYLLQVYIKLQTSFLCDAIKHIIDDFDKHMFVLIETALGQITIGFLFFDGVSRIYLRTKVSVEHFLCKSEVDESFFFCYTRS